MSFKHGPKPVVGLIGAIGAGKSTAARGFAARGARVIDADAIGHEALRQPEIIALLVKRWGGQIVREDGSLDRREIGRIVFADPDQRSALEAAVFPYITGRARAEISAAQANPEVAFVVLDAAVLLEAGWGDFVDVLVFVDAPRELRLARLATRSGWGAAELDAREAAQLPIDTKKERADVILVNDRGPAELQEGVDRVLVRLGVAVGVRSQS